MNKDEGKKEEKKRMSKRQRDVNEKFHGAAYSGSKEAFMSVNRV